MRESELDTDDDATTTIKNPPRHAGSSFPELDRCGVWEQYLRWQSHLCQGASPSHELLATKARPTKRWTFSQYNRALLIDTGRPHAKIHLLFFVKKYWAMIVRPGWSAMIGHRGGAVGNRSQRAAEEETADFPSRNSHSERHHESEENYEDPEKKEWTTHDHHTSATSRKQLLRNDAAR